MSQDPLQIPEIDRLVHEPARLAILSVLVACARAEFLFLERATGLTRGNLSVQLTRLEQAGLIEITKQIVGRRTLTTAAITAHGRATLNGYWADMERLRALSTIAAATPGRKPRPRRTSVRTLKPSRA